MNDETGRDQQARLFSLKFEDGESRRRLVNVLGLLSQEDAEILISGMEQLSIGKEFEKKFDAYYVSVKKNGHDKLVVEVEFISAD